MSAREDVARQLRLILLTHFWEHNCTPAEIAKQISAEEWSVRGMLAQHRWDIQLCCTLADCFGVEVSVRAAPTGSTSAALDRYFDELAAPLVTDLAGEILKR